MSNSRAYALSGSSLVYFDLANPSTGSIISITGVHAGDTLVGIDFRPETGFLYGLGVNATADTAQLYAISTQTGVVAAIGAGIGGIGDLPAGDYGFDFNPAADRLRIVSDADQNLRVNPNTGALVAADSQLAFVAGDPNAAANPNAVGAAYTNNVAGTTTTTLYVIDSALDVLALQGSIGGAPTSPKAFCRAEASPVAQPSRSSV